MSASRGYGVMTMGDTRSPWPCSECGSVSWLAQAQRDLIHERDLSEAAAEVERLRETLRRILAPLRRSDDRYLRSVLMFQLGAREPWLWEDDE